MDDPEMKCPLLCCDQTFTSKSTLIEHLAEVSSNIICPICNNKWSSISHLVEHLTLDNCQPNIQTQTITFDVTTDENNENITENSTNNHVSNSDQTNNGISESPKVIDPFSTTHLDSTDGSPEVKMYVELLSKQLTKPCLKTQEVKLVKEHGVSRYMIMSNEDSNLSVGSTVVTKQNNDGTISLTTVKDIKMESETVITQGNDAEDNLEEVYNCNTCGVSFTSVIQHIQNYHNDEDVVVVEGVGVKERDEGGSESQPDEYENSLTTEELPDEKQQPRRIITETGDIVSCTVVLDPTGKTVVSPKQEEVPEKESVNTKRFVQIENFCDSVVKDIKQPDDKNELYHTVVMKEIQTQNDKKVKMYKCMSCSVYVSSLEEFRTRPCKLSKNGPYHKVVVKEVATNVGQTVKVYNCTTCSIYVSSLEEFKSRPCKVLKYSCPHCYVSYENSKSLCAHMKVHKIKTETGKSNTSDVNVCTVCGTTFTTNKSLKLHKRMHDPIKKRPIEPPVEGAEGGEASQDKFLCSICDKLIPMDYRVIHQNSHKNGDKFNCDVCNKKFHSKDYLDMHMNVHSIDKVTVNKQDKSLPYTCLYCHRQFARPHEKVKHERIHTGEKPHSCEICGKSFRVSYCLTLHMRTHTGARPYACPHCGKRFKAHSVYNHHLLTHSEVRAYKCPYCPKAFKTSVQLAGHKNSHTKPFSCQHCNRPFASLYAVRVHTETHTRQNNLKFSCSLCGASYARAFALKDHIKQVHKQDIDNPEVMTTLIDDDWMAKSNQDSSVVEEIQISKDLPNEINELGITSELIV